MFIYLYLKRRYTIVQTLYPWSYSQQTIKLTHELYSHLNYVTIIANNNVYITQLSITFPSAYTVWTPTGTLHPPSCNWLGISWSSCLNIKCVVRYWDSKDSVRSSINYIYNEKFILYYIIELKSIVKNISI